MLYPLTPRAFATAFNSDTVAMVIEITQKKRRDRVHPSRRMRYDGRPAYEYLLEGLTFAERTELAGLAFGDGEAPGGLFFVDGARAFGLTRGDGEGPSGLTRGDGGGAFGLFLGAAAGGGRAVRGGDATFSGLGFDDRSADRTRAASRVESCHSCFRGLGPDWDDMLYATYPPTARSESALAIYCAILCNQRR